MNGTQKTIAILYSGMFLVFVVIALAGDFEHATSFERSRAVLDCVERMDRGAPAKVREADDSYDAALHWCSDFIDQDGRP